MSRKTQNPANSKRSFEFWCDAPDADEVYLAGNFNEWHTGACPLTKHENGQWSTEVPLEQGPCEFGFLIDGKWLQPERCHVAGLRPSQVCNEFGTTNQRVEVA